MKLLVPVLTQRSTQRTCHLVRGNVAELNYPPRRRWRSSVHPDSSLVPWGRSAWWPPARSAPDGLSPSGQRGDSGFASRGTGSCPRRQCSSASWKNRTTCEWRDIKTQTRRRRCAVPRIQDCAREVTKVFEDGCGVLQLQKLLLFVLEESEGEAKYDLRRKTIKALTPPRSLNYFTAADPSTCEGPFPKKESPLHTTVPAQGQMPDGSWT